MKETEKETFAAISIGQKENIHTVSNNRTPADREEAIRDSGMSRS